jgi:hypothetical protein
MGGVTGGVGLDLIEANGQRRANGPLEGDAFRALFYRPQHRPSDKLVMELCRCRALKARGHRQLCVNAPPAVHVVVLDGTSRPDLVPRSRGPPFQLWTQSYRIRKGRRREPKPR